MKKIIFIVISIIVLNSCCTTPMSMIAPNVDFSRYTFAAIGTDSKGNNVILTDAHMRIQNTLASHGYNVIVDTRIGLLDYEKQTKLFVVEFSISSTSDESICLISFTDYLSGNYIATFRGSFGLGVNIAGDQRGAVDSAIKQMSKALQNKNL